MSDIFQEVEEEVRRERMKQLWERYGTYVVALAVAIVLAVAGWRGYEYWQQQRAEAAGTRFEAAARLAAAGQHAEAEAAFAALAAEAPAGYAVLARFAAAAELGARDRAAAAKAYDALAADTRVPPLLRDLAQVRAALLLVDTVPYADLLARLEPLAAPTGAFRHSARELLALSAWKAGDTAAARRWIEATLGDAETPSGVRQRIEVMRALVAAPAERATN